MDAYIGVMTPNSGLQQYSAALTSGRKVKVKCLKMVRATFDFLGKYTSALDGDEKVWMVAARTFLSSLKP
jgi:hypothetical protein